MHDEKAYFRETVKNWQPPGIELGASDLTVSALPPELWPPGNSQPSQFSVCAVRGGATLSEIFSIHSTCT